MKKILISMMLTVFAMQGFSQQNKIVKLDDQVSVNLPDGFRKIDTLGQQTYTVNAEYGYLMVSRSPNPPGNKTLKKEKDLKNVFKEYIQKVQGSLTDGNVINDHDTIVHNMVVCEFTLQTDTGSGVQLRKFRILYTKPVTYTFQYLYDEGRKDVAQKEMSTFFASIKTAPDLDGSDQFITYGQPQGINIVTIALIGGGVLIIVLIVLTIRKKRREDMLINDMIGKG